MTPQREGAQQWRGAPLDMEEGMDPYGIKEIVLEFDTGEEEIMRPSSARSSAPTSCTRLPTTCAWASCAASASAAASKGASAVHGIILETGTATGTSDERYSRMPKITVRYADGVTLIFVPDAGRRFFDEDDALKLAEIWEEAAQIAEWSGIAEGIDERFAR